MHTPPPPTSSPQGKKLLDQVSDSIRVKHYSSRTEKTYKDWIRRYILFHNKRHPKDMDAPEINQFLEAELQDPTLEPMLTSVTWSSICYRDMYPS